MSLPDISKYYERDENALEAHADWLCEQSCVRQFQFLQPRVEREKITQVVEFGPGSGLLAHHWKRKQPALVYTGLEACSAFVEIASSPEVYPGDYSGLTFVWGDVRDYLPPQVDLGVAFKFLKHFSLKEWDDILACVCSGVFRFACFDVQVADQDADNGKDFPHTFVTEAHLRQALEEVGFGEVERQVWEEGEAGGLGRIKNIVLWTKRE
jgi:hypothetical protein